MAWSDVNMHQIYLREAISEWNQFFLVRLLRANVMACCFTARVAAGSDLDVRGASYLGCQRRFRLEENSRDMVIRLR